MSDPPLWDEFALRAITGASACLFIRSPGGKEAPGGGGEWGTTTHRGALLINRAGAATKKNTNFRTASASNADRLVIRPDADIWSRSPVGEPTLRLVAHNYHKLSTAAYFRAWPFI